MHEDRIYRDHFRKRLEAEAGVPNPWRRSKGMSVGNARSARCWQEERRPGRFSVLGYALTGICLCACLSAQFLGASTGAIGRGAAWLVANPGVREQMALFVSMAASFF